MLIDNPAKKYKYNAALAKIEKQEYEEAYELLKNLNYKDSSDEANRVIYLWAKQLYENEEYDKAAYKFKQLPLRYEDSEEMYYKAMYEYVFANIVFPNDPTTLEQFLSDLKDVDYLESKSLFYYYFYHVDINITENANDTDTNLDTVNWSKGDAIYAHYVVHYDGSMSRYASNELEVYGQFSGSRWNGNRVYMTCKPEDKEWINISWDPGSHPNPGETVFRLYTKDGSLLIGEKRFNIALD